MAIRRIDDFEPIRGVGGPEELRRVERSGHLASGTLACPQCDAPVAPAGRVLTPAAELACPYCLHHGRVRDFLTLGSPSRPAHVHVRVVKRALRITATG